jgi:hypothetical protein
MCMWCGRYNRTNEIVKVSECSLFVFKKVSEYSSKQRSKQTIPHLFDTSGSVIMLGHMGLCHTKLTMISTLPAGTNFVQLPL